MGFISQVLIIKYVVLKSIVLKPRHIEIIFNKLKIEKHSKFILEESFLDEEAELPDKLKTLFFCRKFISFYLNIYNTNQQNPKDGLIIAEMFIFRWDYKKLKTLLEQNKIPTYKKDYISIFITTGRSENYLGWIPINEEIVFNKKYNLITKTVEKLITGVIPKTSFLLYGPPGNGKTTFIRNLAQKYCYDLYFIDLNKETTNTDIIKLSSFVSKKSIILFEDFDSLYDKRKLIKYEETNFSFDAILNLLDGVYNQNKNVIFAFTANDLTKIDDSLLNRRGRIKNVLEIKNPDYDERMELLKNKELVEKTEGMSLDNIYDLIS